MYVHYINKIHTVFSAIFWFFSPLFRSRAPGMARTLGGSGFLVCHCHLSDTLREAGIVWNFQDRIIHIVMMIIPLGQIVNQFDG